MTPAAAAQEHDPTAAGGSVVYLIGSRDVPLLKIGTSTDLPGRLAAVQAGSPVRLAVIWHTPGGHDLEAHLHGWFRHRRAHGEWFRFSDRADAILMVAEAVEHFHLTPAPAVGEWRRERSERVREVQDRLVELIPRVGEAPRMAADILASLRQLDPDVSRDQFNRALVKLRRSGKVSSPDWGVWTRT